MRDHPSEDVNKERNIFTHGPKLEELKQRVSVRLGYEEILDLSKIYVVQTTIGRKFLNSH